jgi:hypothetical protein
MRRTSFRIPGRYLATATLRRGCGECSLSGSNYVLHENTLMCDRLHHAGRDLPATRRTFLTLSAFPTAVWLYTVWFSRHSVVGVSVPVPHHEESLEGATHEVLKRDQAYFIAGNLLWITLLLWDFKACGHSQGRLAYVATVFICRDHHDRERDYAGPDVAVESRGSVFFETQGCRGVRDGKQQQQ